MLVRVETSRVGPARLPSAASWRGSSSFAYRIHWRSGRSGGGDAHLSENAREFVGGERVIEKPAKAPTEEECKRRDSFLDASITLKPGCDAADPPIVAEV